MWIVDSLLNNNQQSTFNILLSLVLHRASILLRLRLADALAGEQFIQCLRDVILYAVLLAARLVVIDRAHVSQDSILADDVHPWRVGRAVSMTDRAAVVVKNGSADVHLFRRRLVVRNVVMRAGVDCQP